MKLRPLLAALAFYPAMIQAASYTANLSIGQLYNAGGSVIPDGGGTWAVIVAATAGTPPSGGALPGGLTDGHSLTSANLPQAFTDFNSVTLTAGTYSNFTIQKVGSFNGSTYTGIEGAIMASIPFSIYDESSSGYLGGTLWGIYWFPGKSAGDTLSGPFEVGGFADSSRNVASSNSDAGTTIGSAGTSNTVNFFESDFNQNTLKGPPTGLDVSRFTAVAQFSWDADSGAAGAQGGEGFWDTTGTNWNTGSSNYAWASNGQDNDAIFGATAGIVTIRTGGVTANDLTFNTTGYTIVGDSVTFNGTMPTVTTAAGVNATIASQILGGAGLAKAGEGSLILAGANAYTGATRVNAGTLVVNGSLTDSPVHVAASARLGGSGTISGSATTFAAGGVHSPGNGVGTQTVADVTYSRGSIFEWELGSSPDTSGRGITFDAVNVTGTMSATTDAIFRVVLNGSQTFGSEFWNSPRTWTNIFTSGDGVTSIANWATVFSGGFEYYNYGGVDGTLLALDAPTTEGFFTLSGSSLSWSTVPEASNAMIGGLICLGLLRRQRHPA